ncbi:MAG: hypothetical protein ABJA02_15455 [Acidobacteriota bacterium]
MKNFAVTFAAVFITIFAAPAFAQNATPVEAVRSFYAFHHTHDRSFSRAAIEARKKWFSANLYELFLNELKRENAFLNSNPNEKPYFEDLSVDPIDESCLAGTRQLHKQVTVKPGAEDKSAATVRAIFAFPSPCKDPDTTIYTIEIVRASRGWVIDNVIYEDGSNLVEDLKRKDY